MYRIKRIAALAAAAAMVLALGSCGKGAETALTATADDAPVFMLSSLPDIGKYEPAQNYKRYSNSYCGKLTPGNYGTLIPFVGRDSEFSPPEDPETVINESLYGLMTVDGKVVVDPVYTAFDIYDIGGGKSILALTSVPGDSSDPNNFHNLLTVAASDGSWVVNRIDAYVVSSSGGKIVLNIYDDKKGCNCVEVLDLKGKQLAAYDNAISDYGYLDGILYILKESSDFDEYYDYVTELIDDNGNTVLEGYNLCSALKNDLAVAREGDYFGIVRRDGTWLLDPVYENVETIGVDTQYYHAGVNGSGVLLDSKGNIISRYDGESYGRNYIIAGNSLVFNRMLDDDVTYYNIDGKPITCKESGAVAVNCNEYLGLFFGSKDGVGYVFDIGGKMLASLEGATGMDAVSGADYGNYYVLYVANGSDSVGVVFSSDTHKEVYRFTVNEGNSSSFIASITSEGVAVLWQSDDQATSYRVVDFATDKVLVDSCPFAIIVRAGGNAYVNVCNDDFIKIYDSGFGLLLKVTNNYTD